MFVVEERESTDSAFALSGLNRSLVGGGGGSHAVDERCTSGRRHVVVLTSPFAVEGEVE